MRNLQGPVLIPLLNSIKFACIDLEFYAEISKYSWCLGDGRYNTEYVYRSRKGEGKNLKEVMLHQLIWRLSKQTSKYIGEIVDIDHIIPNGLINFTTNLQEIPHSNNTRKGFDLKNPDSGIIYNKARLKNPWQYQACIRGNRFSKSFKSKEEAREYKKQIYIKFELSQPLVSKI